MGSLYDRHAPSLFALGLRMLGEPREAEDLLHDVFLEAWQSARQYDPKKASVATWLRVRLRSRALDRLNRAELRHTRSLQESPAAFELAFETSPSEVDGIAVRRALDGVEANVRRVLELTFFDGLTAREIAELAGVPVGTVKSRLARGLDALEALL
jgi:RNA polymerase sigma-70 factor, ECF subfamily